MRWTRSVFVGITLAAVCGIFAPLFLYAQTAMWEFQNFRMLTDSWGRDILRRGPLGREGLRNIDFLSEVGGVNFEAVASRRTTWWDIWFQEPVRLQYERDREDGQRLSIYVGDKVYRPSLWDWQLKPIAIYAASPHTAVASLFGQPEEAERERWSDARYFIQYHEAFKDTLLGLRLLQADIVYIDPARLWELPQWGGTVVKAPKEQEARPEEARRDADGVEALKSMYRYQSWILTDIDVDVEWAINDGELSISGSPYYYFWISKDRLSGMDILEARECAEVLRARLAMVVSPSCNRLTSPPEWEVKEVSELTRDLGKRMDYLAKINPAVYDAVDKTMKFGAFFRYVRAEYPEAWVAFVGQISSVELDSGLVVKTPSIWTSQN
jgi:hypothetical protein